MSTSERASVDVGLSEKIKSLFCLSDEKRYGLQRLRRSHYAYVSPVLLLIRDVIYCLSSFGIGCGSRTCVANEMRTNGNDTLVSSSEMNARDVAVQEN